MHLHRPAVLHRLNGDDEGYITPGSLCTPARLVYAWSGIVHPDTPHQRLTAITLQHHSHQFVFESSGDVVIDVDFARQLQRRGALLAQVEKINGQKPFRGGSLVQRRIVPVVRKFDGSACDMGIRCAILSQNPRVDVELTYIAAGPVQSVQRRAELLLATLVFEKFFQTDTYLELNRIHCHICFLCFWRHAACRYNITYVINMLHEFDAQMTLVGITATVPEINAIRDHLTSPADNPQLTRSLRVSLLTAASKSTVGMKRPVHIH